MTPSLPLVSVVVLTFNRPHYLRQALTCVVKQTYPNLEILVRDNASEPETTAVVREFSDPRIIHHRHPTNIGMTANVQSGFLAAHGKYVANLHDDDLWQATFIEKLVAVLERHPEAILAFSEHDIIDQQGRVDIAATQENMSIFRRTSLAPGLHQPFQRLALVDFVIPVAVATVFRREAIDWTDFADLASVYDLWLAYLAARSGQACYYLNENLASYRHHGNSESTHRRIFVNDAYIKIYQRLLDDPDLKDLHRIFIPRYADHYRDAAVSLLRNGEREKARSYLKKGLAIHHRPKALLTLLASYLPQFITQHLPRSIRFQ